MAIPFSFIAMHALFFWIISATETASQVSLLFAGDTNINNHLDLSNLALPWEGIRPHILGSDAFLLNHEGSVTKRTKNVSDPTLKEPPALAHSYLAGNVSFVSLANNHQGDFGQSSATDTMAFFKEASIPYAGIGNNWREAGAPVVLNVGGKRIAIIATMLGPVYDTDGRGQACWPAIQCDPPVDDLPGVHYIANITFAETELKARAAQIRPHVDYVILFFHWGANWDWMDGSAGDIWRDRQSLARNLLDSDNVDMIWGTSAHHIQPVEVYKGKTIIYSCGNLLVPLPPDLPPGIPAPEFRTRLGFLYKLHLSFNQGGTEHVRSILEAIPIVSDDWKIQTLRNASDLSWMLQKFNNLSHKFGTTIDVKEDGRWFVNSLGGNAFVV